MSLERDGYVLIENLFGPDAIEPLKAAFAESDLARSERGGETYGARNILGLPQVRAIAKDSKLRALLGEEIQVVRGIFFDKTAGANWPVAWHQDLTLALRERRDIEGWTNWTIKRGVAHAQPPAAMLKNMVTMRLHLDDCGLDNGPLRVIPGSHADGVLPRAEIVRRTQAKEDVITAKSGDALFMKPLILHASSPAKAPLHRRVLHLEFAPMTLLPKGLDWAGAV
jgi:ectoine hydroxylase-related dioxygenase (phytanoyl-CoA dioxygenase family)